MAPPGRYEQLRLAASAAEARAVECRERREGLRSAFATDAEHARRAKERLATATSRAQAAEQRLAEVRALRAARQAQGAQPEDAAHHLPEQLGDAEGTSFAGRLLVALHEGRCNSNDLWLEFATYGGSCDFWEFDGYLNGLWAMPEFDRRVLEQVWWEWERGANS